MKRILPSSLLIVLISLLTSCDLYYEVFPRVAIDLPQPMYNIESDLVKTVRLEPGTAAILQVNDPNRKQIANSFLSAPEPRAGKSIRLGGYFFGGFEERFQLSPKQMQWVADHLDVFALNVNYIAEDRNLGGGITPEGVEWLKQHNSKLKFYCMLFATTLKEPQFDAKIMSDWVIRAKGDYEAFGVRREVEGDGNHLMDMGNKDWQEYFRKFSAEHTKKYHADGVAIDEIMWNGYWGLDVRDMRDYTSVTQIRETCYNWLEAIKKDNSTEVIHQAFWPEAQRHTNGVWGEVSFYSSWRDGHEYEVFYEDMNYEEIVNTISQYGKKKQTYIWGGYYWGAEDPQLQYVVATYLLGKTGDHVVFHPQPIYGKGYPENLGGYDIQTVIDEYEKHKELFDMELGKPKGDFYTKEFHGRKIWVREFEAGIVYVNPNKD